MKTALRIIIFYSLLWFFLILLAVAQQETGILPPEIGLAQLGPGLAGLLMLVLFRRDGHKIVWWRHPADLRHFMLASLVPFAVAIVLLTGKTLLRVPGSDAGSLPLAAFLWAPLGALGEEIGWRGYLQQRLKGNLPGIVIAVLIALLWAPIHVQYFANGIVFFAFFTLLIISFSVFIYAITADAFSVVLATVFHLAVNYASMFFYDMVNSTVFMGLYALIWTLIAAAIVLKNKELFLSRPSLKS